jgi:SAM-dependent methyltransferase
MSGKLAFHELMARLGVGDLHPGGPQVSVFLLEELRKHGVRRVLDVGAGIGNTTARLMSAGFDVTALEPNATVRAILARRLGIEARATSFETVAEPDGSYDAILSESVFYAFDLPGCFAKAYRLLRPGGLFGFAEMLWTQAAEADAVAAIHDETKRIFGIPMAPRRHVTAATWEAALRDAGFSEVAHTRIGPAAPDGEPWARRLRLALGLLRQPALIPAFLGYRFQQRRPWAPPGWLESHAAVWRRN